jgi:origin recognition complex subunit 6
MNEKQMIQTALERVLPTIEGGIPQEVFNTTQDFCFESRNKISTLKSHEEVARHAVCAHLAVEKYMTSLNLPIPSTRQAPVPAKVYNKLLNVFRKTLMPNSESPLKTPSKKRTQPDLSVTPTRTPTPSPMKRKIVSTNPSPAASPSPSKRQRGGPKSTDPKAEDIEVVCSRLKINTDALDAIAYGYKQYNNLVKDRWGLLCGLIYVITSKAQPQLVWNQKIPFTTKIIHSVPNTSADQLEEWIPWAEKIVGDQSWVRQITAPEAKNMKSKKGKKHSSGIGNMITGSFCFTNPRKIQNYNKWKADIYARIQTNP